MKSLSKFIFLFLLLNSLSIAGDEIKITPELKFEGISYWQNLSDTKTSQGIIDASLGMSKRLSKSFKVKSKAVINSDLGNPSKEEQFFYDFPEAYVQWQDAPVTMQAGMNTYSWGITDVFNPLDVTNAKRYSDPLRSTKLGAASVNAKYNFSIGSLEFLFIPKQRKSLLPGTESRWLPRDIYRDISLQTALGTSRIKIPANIRYHYVPDQVLDRALNNNWGTRIQAQVPYVDLSAVFFQGSATSPAVNPAVISGTLLPGSPESLFIADPDVSIRAYFYKVQTMGGSFSTTIGDFIFKGEAAYVRPLSSGTAVPGKMQQYVASGETNFTIFGESFTALLEGTRVVHAEASSDTSTSLSRMFDRSGIIGIRYAPTEYWSLLASHLHDFRYKGSFWHGELVHKWSDTVRSDLSVDIMDGKTETPIGTYRKNDRMILATSFQW